MLSRILVCSLTAFLSFGEVTITDNANGLRMPIMISSDDMYKSASGLRWDRFWDNVDYAKSNHLVFSSAIIVGKMSVTNGWGELQTAMDAGGFVPVSHSWSHPTNITDYNQEYVTSRTALLSALVYPWQKTYKGVEYDVAFVQWGGCTNLDFESTAIPLIVSNNYLGVRSIRIGLKSNPSWVGNAYEPSPIYQHSGANWTGSILITSDQSDSLDGLWESKFDAAYASAWPYMHYGHAWTDGEWVFGTNSVAVSNHFEHIGNRIDCWYTDFGSWLSYLYLKNEATPSVIETRDRFGNAILTISAEAAERQKYGLSVPLTYAVGNATTYTFGGRTAYYRDSVDANWTALSEITTNDYYDGGNCYRNEGTNTLVTQGLPQTVDQFQIKLVPRKRALGFF